MRTFFAVGFAVLATAVALGCGDGDASDEEKDSDQASLNEALARELTMVDAYAQGLPLLRGRLGVAAREFHAQEQEYVNAITKALRGLGGETEAEAEEVDFSEIKSQADFLALLYEMENAAFAYYVDVTPELYTAAPRILATTLAASHAQHLVVLRQGLGAGLAESASEAFESGEVPPPEAPAPSSEAKPPSSGAPPSGDKAPSSRKDGGD